MNEALLILSFVLIYGSVMLFYRIFGKTGLIAMNVLVTILANIEVLLLVNAFGIEMTLGNVLFASTFLITDVLSENHSKKDANRAVVIGSVCSVLFVVISQLWLLYTPSANDWA
ncbi:MAG: queuosine precursor transporter, partial [Muribaculaceae bacterium]|nr:queuosine precursor transporter [Muribaculaceae bacterium]